MREYGGEKCCKNDRNKTSEKKSKKIRQKNKFGK